MSFQCQLQHLPIELIENIIDHIDSPKDLLPFALSSKSFHRLIIPNHLELRHICCHLCHESIWKLLVSTPSLAANVRTLTIIELVGDLDLKNELLYPRSFIGDVMEMKYYTPGQPNTLLVRR